MTTGVVRSHGRKEHDRRQRWAQWPIARRLREQGEAWGGPHQATRHRLGIRWWREILLIGLFYFGYNLVRNHFGSAAVGPGLALNNAEIVIELERALGLYFESTMQGWFLGWDAFISIWNVFYGLLHFSVTFFTLGVALPQVPRGLPALADHRAGLHRTGTRRASRCSRSCRRGCSAIAGRTARACRMPASSTP